MRFIGVGISFQWHFRWFDAGLNDDFDKCLMIGPIQLLFDEE